VKIIKERRSISHFLEKKVSKKIIDELIEFSSYAPSSCNTQPWFFLVFESEVAKRRLIEYIDLGYDKIKEEVKKENKILGGAFSGALEAFAKYGKFDEAPIYILVFARPYDRVGLAQAMRIAKNERVNTIAQESVKTSVAMAMQNFLLLAHAKGLGARVKDGIKFFVGIREIRESFYKEFSIPKEYELLSGIQLCYSTESPRGAGKRLSLDRIRKLI